MGGRIPPRLPYNLSTAYKPMSTILIRTLYIFKVGSILDFVHSGFCPILDFVQFGILFFWILSVLDFVQFGNFVQFGILSIPDFVRFGILTVQNFVRSDLYGIRFLVQIMFSIIAGR